MYKDNFDKLLSEKIDNDFVDCLFASNENYLEDNSVSREINNTLCGLCINSETLAKYIVEKGGLANIIDELKFLVDQDDIKSENIKFSGLLGESARTTPLLAVTARILPMSVLLKSSLMILDLINSDLTNEEFVP